MTTTTNPKRKCIDGGICHHECQPSECFREECCAPFSDSGLDDNWKPIAALPMPVMPQQAEPVAYQARIRPDWKEEWYAWSDCSKYEAEGYIKNPKVNDWHYEVRKLFAQDPSALLGRVAKLESEAAESKAVIDKMSHVFADISITLNGEEIDVFKHSYHDLGEQVAVLKLENELNKVKIAELEAENAKLKEDHEFDKHVMLQMAGDLGAISHHLGIPDNEGGADPILEKIEEMETELEKYSR